MKKRLIGLALLIGGAATDSFGYIDFFAKRDNNSKEELLEKWEEAKKSENPLILFKNRNQEMIGFRSYTKQEVENLEFILLVGKEFGEDGLQKQLYGWDDELNSMEFIPLHHLGNAKTLSLSDTQVQRFSIPKELKLEAFYANRNNQLETLEGLKDQSNLATLSIIDNNFGPTFSIPKELKLETLSVRGSQLNSLQGLENQDELVCLLIDNNNFGPTFSIPKELKLQELSVRENQLNSLQGLEDQVQLKYVSLSSNNLEEVTMPESPFLNYIDLSKNNLKTFSFLNDAGFNAVNNPHDQDSLKIFLSDNPNLKEISLSYHGFTKLEKLSNTPLLEKIVVKTGLINDLEASQRQLIKLELKLSSKLETPFLNHLEIRDNQYLHCSLFSKDSFEKCLDSAFDSSFSKNAMISAHTQEAATLLKKKFLARGIPALYLEQFEGYKYFLSYNKEEARSLTGIHFPSLKLKRIEFLNPNSFESLTHISLENNKFKKLPDLDNFKNIEYLNISNNFIQKDISFPRKIRYLYANNNEIENIKNLDQLTELVRLEASNNKISGKLSLFSKKLEEINLQRNLIEECIIKSQNIRDIDLRYNDLLSNLTFSNIEQGLEIFKRCTIKEYIDSRITSARYGWDSF